MSKTGGGRGTNQHKIRGTSQAKRRTGAGSGESNVVLGDFTKSSGSEVRPSTNSEAAAKLIRLIHQGDQISAQQAAESGSPLLRTVARYSGLVDERTVPRTHQDDAVEEAIAS